MADDFPKTLSKTVSLKHIFGTKTTPRFALVQSQNTLMLYEPRGGIIIYILFLIPARFAIMAKLGLLSLFNSVGYKMFRVYSVFR